MWCGTVPSRTAATWEENYHSYPVATQANREWRLGRCDRPDRLGSGCRLAGVTGPAVSAADYDSAGDELAGDHDSAGDEPAVVDDSAGVADPAQEEDSAGVADSADQQDSAVDDSARDAGPVAQGTPAGTTPVRAVTPDQQGETTMVSEASSLLFPSLPRQIDQTSLLD